MDIKQKFQVAVDEALSSGNAYEFDPDYDTYSDGSGFMTQDWLKFAIVDTEAESLEDKIDDDSEIFETLLDAEMYYQDEIDAYAKETWKIALVLITITTDRTRYSDYEDPRIELQGIERIL